MGLIAELRRRNVFRMAVLYLAAAWLLLQVIDLLIDRGPLPEALGPLSLAVLAIGFPIALLFSWFFELTPEGISLEAGREAVQPAGFGGRRIDFIVIAVLAAAVLVFGWDKWWTGQPLERSVAVLPFANLSDDPSNEYFADGISEEILNLLAKVPNLSVTSRSSAFSFKGQNLDVPTMGAKLNVTHVLEGSVRKSGNQVRITAQLIKVETDTHLWSQTYDRQLEDIFAIQDDIAGAVVDALKITLLGEKPKATATDPEAYALYLQARYLRNQLTGEGLTRAETLLKQALEIDSGFAPAWYLLGNVYKWQAAGWGPLPFYEGYELARQTINKALDVDPQYGPAYAGLAALEMEHGWDFAAAEQHVQKALALHPGDADILNEAASLNRILGRKEAAADLYGQAAALDPLSFETHVWLGLSHLSGGRLDEAADSARMLLSLNPDGVFAHYLLGLVLRRQGQGQAALAEMERETNDTFRLMGLAIVQHDLGNVGASDAALEELIECCASHGDPPGGDFQIAAVYASRGEIDHAFEWLDKAYESRDGSLPIAMTSESFSILHADPRWEPFLDKMGFPH